MALALATQDPQAAPARLARDAMTGFDTQ